MDIVAGKIDKVIVGTRVRSLRDFSGVPKGTEGIIDENYDGGFMVAWDLNINGHKPLPKGYKKYDGKWTIQSGILRDGFSYDEAVYLEEIK